MAFFGEEDFAQSTPRTVEPAKVLPNGVEMHVTVFEPAGSGAHICTVAVCLPTIDVAAPQYAPLGTFASLESALGAANVLAGDVAGEEAGVIFGPF